VRLTAKYGLAADRFRSFEDSYHGLAGRAGDVQVANCASCHGWHDIKPSTDSTSRIHKSNLVATCGSCHPGANVNFTRGSVHVIATESDDKVLYWVSNGYILLIVTLIGSMLLHNVIDFRKKAKIQLAMRRGEIHRHDAPHRLYLRMSLNERLQHGLLLVSFIVLVLTGFALRFPDAWWVASVRSISQGAFELRSLMHRIAGVVLLAVSAYHIWYLAATPRGRQLFKDLLPVRKDLTDAVGIMKYNLGLAQEKPLLDRFSYIEKAEYWALVWGTIVMGVTGFILWFDNTFLGILTKVGWDIARTVHYYEAWLATLAIIVWHFYFVIFNPNTYPINLAFWKGTLTEEEMADEHPLELRRLREGEGGEGEQHR
jgi:cytochrome b subunit of formate dehydrogenase